MVSFGQGGANDVGPERDQDEQDTVGRDAVTPELYSVFEDAAMKRRDGEKPAVELTQARLAAADLQLNEVKHARDLETGNVTHVREAGGLGPGMSSAGRRLWPWLRTRRP